MKLATPVQYVKGVGPRLSEILMRMGVVTVGDLLALVPLRYIDRRKIQTIAELSAGKDQTVTGKVARAGISFLGARRRRIFEIIVEDGSGLVSLKWFYFRERYLKEKFPVGAEVMVSGEATQFGHHFQFLHPEMEVMNEEKGLSDIAGKILPIYPLTEGLYQKTIRKIVRNAWDRFHGDVVPIFPADMAERHGLSDPWSCLQELHFPSSDTNVDQLNSGSSRAYRTLIFEELFFLELGMALRRRSSTEVTGISFPRNDVRHQRFLECLPFTLTHAQMRVIEEIRQDMESERPMNRLLQGDVGSGKTVVAIAAALQAIAHGYQVAFMAPTEILAEQHFETLSELLRPMGVPPRLLTSSITGVEREQILTHLARGEIPLLVGTHALIQEGVKFAKLGLVVVDEQHRFGVMQRAALREKGKHCDILIMTATPIPRTLAMTIYGDLDVSIIDALPPGRCPVITKLYSEQKRDKLYQGILHELSHGRQAYVVYPLVEESEKIDLKDATSMREELATKFEPQFHVALLHGRMSGEEKESIMHDFKNGKIHILVATSVVEVGVDVPNATVMVVEHAERFGLSQLHQLRGRVGRSSHQSYCILVAHHRLSEDAKQRLRVMVESTDGFKIAEEDLRLRGPGEFIGTRQSGIPFFRVANLVRDVDLLSEARAAAFALIARDPHLSFPEHMNIRETLHTRWARRLHLAQVS